MTRISRISSIPVTERCAAYARHITELAAAFNVHIVPIDRARPDAAGAGEATVRYRRSRRGPIRNARVKFIAVAPVIDETTYAVALHELGHVVHPLGTVNRQEGSPTYRAGGPPVTPRDIRLLLLAEESAWEWAQHYALEWTEPMTAVLDLGLQSYRVAARRAGV